MERDDRIAAQAEVKTKEECDMATYIEQAQSISIVSNRVHKQVVEFERSVLSAHDLTLPQFDVLLLVQERPVRMCDIATFAGTSRGNMTGIMDRLETKGLITRDRYKDDRRSVVVALTDAGQALLSHFDKEVAS